MRFLQILDKMREQQEILPDKDILNTRDSNGDGPLLDSGENSKAVEVIKAGNNIDKDFWKKFKQICNNSDLSILLGLKEGQTKDWINRIDNALKQEGNLNKKGERNNLLTGDDHEQL